MTFRARSWIRAALNGDEHTDGESVSDTGTLDWGYFTPSKYGRGMDLPKRYTPIRPALSFRYGRGRELPTTSRAPAQEALEPETETRPLELPVIQESTPIMETIPEDVVRPAPEMSPSWAPIAMCEMQAANPCMAETDTNDEVIDPPPLMRVTLARGPCEVGIRTNFRDDEVIVEQGQDTDSAAIGQAVDIVSANRSLLTS